MAFMQGTSAQLQQAGTFWGLAALVPSYPADPSLLPLRLNEFDLNAVGDDAGLMPPVEEQLH